LLPITETRNLDSKEEDYKMTPIIAYFWRKKSRF